MMRRMRTRSDRLNRTAVFVGAMLVAGCGSQPLATAPPTVAPTLAPTVAPTAPPTAVPSAAPAPIVGTWTRTISCVESLAAFHEAGLDDQIAAWVVGNFVGENETRTPGHECDGAKAPEPHSHFFTAPGAFGSLDANGSQVDDGDYELLDADTLSFPAHARDFGYDGDLPIDFTIDGDTVTFTVNVPDECTGDCRVAWGWALSAFDSPTPWTRTD